MSAITDYKLISTNDDECTAYPVPDKEKWKVYPGDRRSASSVAGPPKGTVLVQTGGNALQAVRQDLFEQGAAVIRVVVPPGSIAGETILVSVPRGDDETSVIAATIPSGAAPGSAFFVRTPEHPPTVVMGVPIDMATNHQENITPVVVASSKDIADATVTAVSDHELTLQEEHDVASTTTSSPSAGGGDAAVYVDDSEYEMVERHHEVV